jgi:hypothetical protein
MANETERHQALVEAVTAAKAAQVAATAALQSAALSARAAQTAAIKATLAAQAAATNVGHVATSINATAKKRKVDVRRCTEEDYKFKCRACNGMGFDTARAMQCGHVVCIECFAGMCKHRMGEIKCPYCQAMVTGTSTVYFP